MAGPFTVRGSSLRGGDYLRMRTGETIDAAVVLAGESGMGIGVILGSPVLIAAESGLSADAQVIRNAGVAFAGESGLVAEGLRIANAAVVFGGDGSLVAVGSYVPRAIKAKASDEKKTFTYSRTTQA